MNGHDDEVARPDEPRALASAWYQSWLDRDMDRLREILAEGFVHTSPFGTLEGREHYLEVVEPMSRDSVVDLEIHEMLEGPGVVVVRFTNHTPKGDMPTCEWIRCDGGRIVAIESYYDSRPARESLDRDSY